MLYLMSITASKRTLRETVIFRITFLIKTFTESPGKKIETLLIEERKVVLNLKWRTYNSEYCVCECRKDIGKLTGLEIHVYQIQKG